MHKLSLGNILERKKSFKMVLAYCKKYLDKYGRYKYHREFDQGTVTILIEPFGQTYKNIESSLSEPNEEEEKPIKVRRKGLQRSKQKK